ncbi:phosphoenolpyruvate synthase [Microbulbifer agarilyticus]|uniref:phosphoenolpyruvate synthase n=1 Tax=Microbulbifer agarilyticus TaxID=260552 RepID=UPI001C959F6B|nr:phosphoenolpyruvate synthase [Microbulbifer agarilyticus]MBY6189395.1 phosphoenolpyruvate synthase [Microbulbifer agarilyticus]
MTTYTLDFAKLGMADVDKVGGKNASLGEMISSLSGAGVSVPGGFATTAEAFREFLSGANLDTRIAERLQNLDVDDVTALAAAGEEIRQWLLDTPFPAQLEKEIREGYEALGGGETAVAVRSSATAEDLPDASFAGQQETFLNIRGIESVLQAVREVFASLYNDRAIAYRVHTGYADVGVYLSAGIQHMVRSETGASGVMFTLDTESGFRDVIFVTAAYGLGETVVQGAVNPDEFYLYKPALEAGRPAILRRNRGSKAIKMVYDASGDCGRSVKTVQVDEEDRLRFALNDEELTELANQARKIEAHYQRPMDIEWAKDGDSGKLFIVQARPETVRSRDTGTSIERYKLQERSEVLCEGRAIGQRIGAGPVRVLDSVEDMAQMQDGDVLVTDMTDPDWEPVLKKASAIVTNRGGRTCHAAIIARELGIPAVVGCGDATEKLSTGTPVTVTCAEGDTGFVMSGQLDFERSLTEVADMPDLPFKIMLNVGNPDRAFAFSNLPNQGVGLARLEFILNRMIGIHPRALLELDRLPQELQHTIRNRIGGYASPEDFIVEKLVEGISTLAAAFAPNRTIVRLSDFKSNEYAHLVGGQMYEPSEENPMLGFRGAARYRSKDFRQCFALECKALKKVRDEMGLTNVEIMVPFVRTPDEARQVIELLEQNGLKRGENGLKVIMMCELPSNALLAEDFLQYFDGFSIGSNDLTQLTLGLDRDSGLVAELFDERDPAVKMLLSRAIQACKKAGKYVGICGQGPSDHKDFAQWLMDEGIDSVSLNPDTAVDTWLYLANQSDTP